ncbi:MAG: type Z 30S ribosomal protein S14 [Candidatus Hydrogenedentota bacterium]
MSTTAKMAKLRKKPKFKIRHHNRCPICGRARGYIRRFNMCRLCFREMAHRGFIPGVVKASW